MLTVIVYAILFICLTILVVGHYAVKSLDQIYIQFSRFNATTSAYAHLELDRRSKQIEFLTRKLSRMDKSPEVPKELKSENKFILTQQKKTFSVQAGDIVILRNDTFVVVNQIFNEFMMGSGLGSSKDKHYKWNLKGECLSVIHSGYVYKQEVMNLHEYDMCKKAE